MLEQIQFIIPSLLVAGFKDASAGLVVGCIIFLGRLIYSLGYLKQGPIGRTGGATIEFFSKVALIGLIVNTVVRNFL
jgi:hypothetical protein